MSSFAFIRVIRGSWVFVFLCAAAGGIFFTLSEFDFFAEEGAVDVPLFCLLQFFRQGFG
jgi:hypothetical protein